MDANLTEPVQSTPHAAITPSRLNRYIKKLITAWLMTVVFLMITSLFAGSAWSQEFLDIERRRDQFPTEPAYMFLPLPYSVPGVGDGVLLIGNLSNIMDTYTDVYFLKITGDVSGYYFELSDLHLIDETLILKAYSARLNKIAFNYYNLRGMDTSKNDYSIVESSGFIFQEGKLELALMDRMLSLYGGQTKNKTATSKIRDPDGSLLQSFSPPEENIIKTSFYGGTLDYTDDFYDPRSGVRLGLKRSQSLDVPTDAVNYYTEDIMLNFYIPVGKISTWGFSYFTSDAYVIREGETNRAVIEAKYCPTLDPTCLANSIPLINNEIAANANGTATSLGGWARLRAYPMDRFKGAHNAYIGTEFRWNISEEVTPFNWWIWKDIRTGVQLAFFYEQGSVAETKADRWKQKRVSYGWGARMITASGGVYRADFAWGDEGFLPQLVFDYPW